MLDLIVHFLYHASRFHTKLKASVILEFELASLVGKSYAGFQSMNGLLWDRHQIKGSFAFQNPELLNIIELSRDYNNILYFYILEFT